MSEVDNRADALAMAIYQSIGEEPPPELLARFEEIAEMKREFAEVPPDPDQPSGPTFSLLGALTMPPLPHEHEEDC